MRTPEERRAEVYLLGEKKIRERKKRLKAFVYCSVCIVFVCSAILLMPYIGNDDTITKGDTAGSIMKGSSGFAGSSVECIEVNGNGISEKYTDRPTVTLVSLWVKDITEGEYTSAGEVTPIYTVTFSYSGGSKRIYELTENTLIYDNRSYPVSEEEYRKLLSYLK